MPVVSIDGWATFLSITTSAPIGNLQVVLAIGSEQQLSYLKRIKNLTIYRNFLREPQPHLPIASQSAFSQQFNFNGTMENLQQPQQHQFGIGSLQPPLTQTAPQPINDAVNRKAQLAARLNSFIENLASELPDQLTKVNPAIGVGMGNYIDKNASIAGKNASIPVKNASILNDHRQQHQLPHPLLSNQQQIPQHPPGKNIRATADLLDELQRALTSASAMRRMTAASGSNESGPNSNDDKLRVRFFIEIDCGANLPKQVIKYNKKHGKRRDAINNVQTNTIDGRQQRENTISEIEPSSYITFEATGPSTNMVNTIDGPVYTTNVVCQNCNPQWNKRFDVFLPIDYLLNVSYIHG